MPDLPLSREDHGLCAPLLTSGTNLCKPDAQEGKLKLRSSPFLDQFPSEPPTEERKRWLPVSFSNQFEWRRSAMMDVQ
jgi:hypothetical protein